jgi:transposase InsO family protein
MGCSSLSGLFDKWVDAYKGDFPHMALGYQTPQQFANDSLLKCA